MQFRSQVYLLVVLILVAVAVLPVLTYPIGRDQGEFAVIGRGILQGKIPYVDLWNPKPPAVFYVYALAMAVFGQTSAALRTLDLLIAPPTAAALYWLGKRIANSRVGLWAALLFGVFYFSETFWTLTQNDGIVLLPMCAALVCALKAAEGTRRAALWALAAGALSGLILWFKYPFLLFDVVVVLAYVWMRLRPQVNGVNGGGRGEARPYETDGRGEARPYETPGVTSEWWGVWAFIAGKSGIVLAGIATLASIGAFKAWLESAVVTTGYTALGFDIVIDQLQTALGFRWGQWGLLFALVGVGVVMRMLTPSPNPLPEFGEGENRVGWRVVWAWLVAGGAIMLVQLRGYDYHWLPMLPALCLLAAGSVEKILGGKDFTAEAQSGLTTEGTEITEHLNLGTERGGDGFRARVLSVVIGLGLLMILVGNTWGKALPYLTGQMDEQTYYAGFVAGDYHAEQSYRVAAYLRERNVPGDSLYIWGFRPEVYYLSRLNPATRFIFQFPLVGTWYPAAWREENVDILWAALPPYVLVLQVDYMPYVTGRHEDSNQLLQEYTELNDWLIYNYERDTQIGDFFVWKRKPNPS